MLTATDVANELKLSKTRVLSLITSGRLKATKLGPIYVIDPKDLEAFKQIKREPGRPARRRTQPSALQACCETDSPCNASRLLSSPLVSP